MSIARMATLISLGVIASFASGFLCLLVVGIKWASSMKRELIGGEHNNAIISRIICSRCGTSFFDNPQLGLKDVLCDDCKCPVCSACALRYTTIWRCAACIKRRDEMISKDLSLKDIRKRFPMMDNSSTSNNGRKENDVWNLIELLTQNILGFNFEKVKITNLSNDISYLEFMDKFEGVLSLTLYRLKSSIQLIVDGVASNLDNPTNIEIQLKGLVQEIIEEASNIDPIKLMKIKGSSDGNVSSKTYEDVLAIAILNKVIESVILQQTNTPKNNNIKEELNNERDILGNLKLEAKISELKNHALNKTWNQRKISIPDLGIEIPRNVNRIESRWEENWLFRRKKTETFYAKSECKKQAITSIFIPSPITYVSPKIGDSCVDDISDLSDLSDSEVELLVDN